MANAKIINLIRKSSAYNNHFTRKMLDLALILLLFASAQADFPCALYTCDESLAPNTCAARSIHGLDMIIKLQGCDETKICDLESWPDDLALCKSAYEHPTLYPGEYCRNSTECYSKKCNEVCVGKDTDESCHSSTDCSPGNSCYRGRCEHTLLDGSACTIGEQSCGAASVCDQGVCIRIGSQQNGQSAANPATCASFYIQDAKCSEAPRLVTEETGEEEEKYQCPETKQCMYGFKETEEKITEPCVCGVNNNGTKYCQPGIGDVDLNDVFI